MEEKEKKSAHPKGVRIIAMVGVILLVLMYIITLVAALTTSPASAGLFKASLGASILIPIVLWGYIVLAKCIGGKK